jgi:hypothetical protein
MTGFATRRLAVLTGFESSRTSDGVQLAPTEV